MPLKLKHFIKNLKMLAGMLLKTAGLPMALSFALERQKSHVTASEPLNAEQISYCHVCTLISHTLLLAHFTCMAQVPDKPVLHWAICFNG